MFDVLIASVALVVTAPLIVVAAILIWIQDGGPILYLQTRVGKDGAPFRLLKLRTMTIDADARLVRLRAGSPALDSEWRSLQKLRNDPRITFVGAFLRRSCIDELPQLLNVLRGDMSFVGPRPITEAQIAQYGRSFGSYVTVRPGLTGLWQVSRGDHPSFAARVAADRLYFKRKTFFLDLWIIIRTIPVVLFGRGCH